MTTRNELIVWAEARGWKKDRWGHLQKTDPTNGARYRFKLSRIAVRYEVRSIGWVRLQSGYFSKLSITPDGKLAGLAR